MAKKTRAHMRKFLFGNTAATIYTAAGSGAQHTNVCEEYANSFRTESYNEFWLRVLSLSNININIKAKESTTADRLPSYRLFAEHLLDPDQPTASRILALARIRPATHSLLSDYFNQSASASFLCSLLLKHIDKTRATLHLPDNKNPFGPSLAQVQATQAGCSQLLKRLEMRRDKARTKMRIVKQMNRGLGVLLVAVTASISVVVALHSVAVLVAAAPVSVGLMAWRRRVGRTSAQLDAAAKGTYILNRDLDTISRLVGRVDDEVEHMRGMGKFIAERGEEHVARLVKKNDCSLRQQLDELEEHLYLCFMTINRARTLVAKQILDPAKYLFTA